jgi:hypothetical protein
MTIFLRKQRAQAVIEGRQSPEMWDDNDYAVVDGFVVGRIYRERFRRGSGGAGSSTALACLAAFSRPATLTRWTKPRQKSRRGICGRWAAGERYKVLILGFSEFYCTRLETKR